MSRQPENTFIASVHKYLPPISRLYRMKNHNEYNGGIADCWYSGVSDMWVEYKFLKLPVRDRTVIDLVGGNDPTISTLQQEWLKGRHDEGRKVGVIVGCKDGGVWFPGTSWETPLTAGEFRSRLIARKDVATQIFDLVSK